MQALQRELFLKVYSITERDGMQIGIDPSGVHPLCHRGLSLCRMMSGNLSWTASLQARSLSAAHDPVVLA